MLRQIFKVFLLIGLLNLSLPGTAKAPIDQSCLITSHGTNALTSSSASIKTDKIIISLAEDENESSAFIKTRKPLNLFCKSTVNSAPTYSLPSIKESPINHLPIYIITHDYRV